MPGAAADFTPEGVTVESLRERLASLGEDPGPAGELYRRAIEQLERAASSSARGAEARRLAAEAPGELARIREGLERPAEAPAPEVSPEATLSDLEQGLATATAALTSAQNQVIELQGETTRRQERRTEIPGLRAEAQRKLEEASSAAESTAEAETPEVARARRSLGVAQQRAARAELEALEAELASYDARRDLLPVRRDRAERRVGQAERLVAAWQKLVSDRREADAQRQAREEARRAREAARQNEVLEAFAGETAALAAQRTEPDGMPQRITRATERAAQTRARLVELRRQYRAVSDRIEASGLNRATGLLLRRQFESLPDAGELRKRLTQTARDLEETEYELIERNDARVAAGDVDAAVRGLMARVEAPEPRRADLEAVARELATARRDLLQERVNDATRSLDALYELVEESRSLLDAAVAYREYIGERIFGVRSIAGNQMPRPRDFAEASGWFLDGSAWGRSLERVRFDTMRRVPETALAVVMVGLLFAGGRVAKRRLPELADLVGRYKTDTLGHTLSAVLLTGLAALPLPALLWVIGWVLARPPEQESVATAVGAGLRMAAWLLLPALFVMRSLRRDGLADAHFRWPERAVASALRQLRWFVPVAVPALALVTAVEQRGEESASGSLGRAAFTVAMVALAVLLQRLTRPRGVIASEYLKGRETKWVGRLRYVLSWSIVLVPVTLAIVAWMGYFYTAIQLGARLERTAALVLAFVVLNAILLRWLFIARRRVAVEDARRRREQALAEANKQAADDKPTESSVPPVDEDKLNIPSISSQTKQLFGTVVVVSLVIGLYVVWADVLPALRMLDRVEVYPTPRLVDAAEREAVPALEVGGANGGVSNGEAAGGQARPNGEPGGGGQAQASGGPSLPGVPVSTAESPAGDAGASGGPVSVTLADLGLAAVLLVATVVAFRNLPALVEIMVLQRLPLDAGSRYALSTVLRYLIAIVGVLAAFGAVNISWSNVQWLAAALTFGLAFGLQEIFANFVSGLIILAERPIRIGDTVTVGNVSGTVTRIKMRATTITDWDRKELVVPNKTFITGDVINWTLSSTIMRLIVPVGVAYGADVREAERVLLRVASEQANVLKDPKPHVIFQQFGDSTLNFELRVFMSHCDQLLSTRHDLHMRITESFREAGIEIAFPQRDINIRSIGELREAIGGRRVVGEESVAGA